MAHEMLLQLSSLMKLILYVVHMEKAIKVKLLGESRPNILYRCRTWRLDVLSWNFVLRMGVGHSNYEVLVLAATSTPYALDQAVQRQFDKRIYIPLPDSQAMQHRFKMDFLVPTSLSVTAEVVSHNPEILSPLIQKTDVKKIIAGRGRPLSRRRYTRSIGMSSARTVDAPQVLSVLNKCTKE
ncbi:unnamed protein product [Triticum turgidum subsp. durum]|uniref:Uncharacterized protein n=1 Tax=Triticum turgidum subsp. durum TaxID=4567 RepID=A0A9R1Q704_TRITD|nr:unnamed protein product [Triticum turgidum subsp. durum]